MSEEMVCKYETCSCPATHRIDVTISDAEDPDTVKWGCGYCEKHVWMVELAILMAAVATNRLGVVTWKVSP